jgi:hypothetical protein
MNVRDPFNLRRSNALTILQGNATRAAINLTQKALESGAQAIESGRQAVEDMSGFSIPKNVPSFTDPQRELENRVWGASGVTARSNGYAPSSGVMSDMQEKMGGFFEKNRDLPMYKDKPFSYASSRRNRPLWRRKRLLALAGLLIMFVLYLMGFVGGNEEPSTKPKKGGLTVLWGGDKKSAKPDWLGRREMVVDAFKLSWDAYERYAWGMETKDSTMNQKLDMADFFFQATMSTIQYRNAGGR